MGRTWHEIVKMKVAVAVVGLVSVTGIAAAGAVVSSGDGTAADPGATTTTSTTVTPDDGSTTTTTTVAAPDDGSTTTTTTVAAPAPAGDPAAACESHGEHVSRVAHETPPGPGHGAAVSAAAHDHSGECGDADTPAVTPPAPPATTTVPDDDQGEHEQEHAPGTEAPESDGAGHGGGHGQGHGGGDG